MNINKIKSDVVNLNAHQIINYLNDNQLDSQYWFNVASKDNSETIFYNLFLKDYELSSLLLNAFYPKLSNVTSLSVNQNEQAPCYIGNYFKVVSSHKRLIDVLAEQLNAAHYYPEKQLEVVGYFAKGYNKILDYTVGISRTTLTWHNTFFPNLLEDSKNLKTHDFIKKINNSCYTADNTISVFLHYLEKQEIVAYKNQSNWHNLIAYIPLVSTFCKLHKIAHHDLQPDSDARFEIMKGMLSQRIIEKGIVLNKRDQTIFNELKNADYEPVQHEYTIYLPSDTKLCQPFQSLNEIVAFSHIKTHCYEQIEQVYLNNKLPTYTPQNTKKIKI